MDHRSYQSVLPTHNKLLQKRWDETYFQEHRRRVKTAIPVVSTAAPSVRPHVVHKLKKQQLESERSEAVQRDNNTLMLHMEDIMKKGSYVDHRNIYNHRSLNYEKRVNEIRRIQTENIKMLGRIQSRPPNYCVSEWVTDRGEKEKLLRMITAHPTQQSYSAKTLLKKEKAPESLPSLVPLSKEKRILDVNVSDTDTQDSLERELEIARNKIPHISKASLDEIKSICINPPVGFKLIIDANSILFTHKLQRFARISLTLHDFQSFDKNNIPFSVLEKLEPYVYSPEFSAEKLRTVSLSIVSLMEWVASIFHYGILVHKLKQYGTTSTGQQDTTLPT